MSTATVLYDAPGPLTRRRQRIYSVVFLVVLVAVLAWVGYKLNTKGEFDVIPKLFAGNILTAIWEGLVATVKAAVLAIIGAVILGFMLAVGRLSDHRWVRLPCVAVVEFFRAIPVLLMMVFLSAYMSRFNGLDTNTQGLIAVVGALVLYNGSVLAEVFRAGVNAVPKGQGEAAYAVGMRKSQVMTLILMPQAVRFMLPAVISQCVVALKDTSLGFIAAYLELVGQGRQIALYLNNNLMVYVLIAIIFIILNNIVSELATWLERRAARKGGGAAGAVEAVEDVLPAG